MRSSIKFILGILLVLPFSVMAHGYWLETEGSHKVNEAFTVKLFYGEYSSGEKLSGNFLDKMKDIHVFVTIPGVGKKEIPMKQLADYWVGNFVPGEAGTYSITGINNERDVQDWTKHNLGIVRPVQYLKTTYQVGTSTTNQDASSFLDIQLSPTKTGYEFLVTKDNKLFESAKLAVGAFNSEEKILTTDKNGKCVFTADKPGIYLVVIEWIDKTPGEFKEKKYETVRHRLDFTFTNP